MNTIKNTPFTLGEIDNIIGDYVHREVAPLIGQPAALGGLRRPHLAICVAYKPYTSTVDYGRVVKSQRSYKFDGQPFQYDYENYAYRKCELAYGSELFTREVIYGHGGAGLTVGDTLLAGGVFLYRWAIGISGVDNWDDEALGVKLAAELWRMYMRRHSAWLAADRDYVGQGNDP